jgi:hypothetical protein
MVTADFSTFTENYNAGSSVQQSQHTGVSEAQSVGKSVTKNDTDPITNTSTDRQVAGSVTTTTTPKSAAKNVNLTSELAEATYVDPIIGAGNEVGMPSLDTSHGSSASGQWSVSEGNEVKEEYGTPEGELTQVSGAVKQTSQNVNGNSNTSTQAQADYVKSINDSVGGTVTTGHHDYNGYNLTASINAVVQLLPYDFLKSILDPLFYSFNDIFGEEE